LTSKVFSSVDELDDELLDDDSEVSDFSDVDEDEEEEDEDSEWVSV